MRLLSNLLMATLILGSTPLAAEEFWLQVDTHQKETFGFAPYEGFDNVVSSLGTTVQLDQPFHAKVSLENRTYRLRGKLTRNEKQEFFLQIGICQENELSLKGIRFNRHLQPSVEMTSINSSITIEPNKWMMAGGTTRGSFERKEYGASTTTRFDVKLISISKKEEE